MISSIYFQLPHLNSGAHDRGSSTSKVKLNHSPRFGQKYYLSSYPAYISAKDGNATSDLAINDVLFFKNETSRPC